MRITRENIEELGSVLVDLEAVASDLTSAVDTWLDEDTDGDTRADARAEIEDNIGGLEDACLDALRLLRPKALVA